MNICFMRSYQACDRYRPDCQKILANLPNWKKTRFPNEADAIVQFFCMETDECIEEIAWQLRYIGKLKKEGAIVIVAGCAANMFGNGFLEIPEVDYVIQHKPIAEEVLRILGQKTCKNKYFLEDEKLGDFVLEISHGCYKTCGPCNFCFNSLAKIPLRSVPMENLLKTVKYVTERGVRKILISGLNVANYGIDFSKNHIPLLHELIRKISENEKVEVIDVQSVTVVNMYPELLEELSSNHKVDYIEIGCQSFSNQLLKTMNVGITTEQIETICKALSHKTFRPIFIIGHPGETEEDFEATLALIRKYKLMNARLPTYVCVEGTPSSRMEQVPKEIICERFKRARGLLVELQKEYFDRMIGKEVDGYLRYSDRMIAYQTPGYYTWEMDYRVHYAIMKCKRTFEESKKSPIKADVYDKVRCVILSAEYSERDAEPVVLQVRLKSDLMGENHNGNNK